MPTIDQESDAIFKDLAKLYNKFIKAMEIEPISAEELTHMLTENNAQDGNTNKAVLGFIQIREAMQGLGFEKDYWQDF